MDTTLLVDLATLEKIAILIALLPLVGAIFAGVLSTPFSIKTVHRFLITLIGIAFFASLYLVKYFIIDGHEPLYFTLYTWASAGILSFDIAFYIDRLSVLMSSIVLFVSWMVHIYTIGYMDGDPGYKRFFSYVSLFTFAMLMLVYGGNFLVLFFGWEGVGLVSYLLIGFWFKRDSAAAGGLKAFLVNRISDIGFLLGTAAVLYYFSSIDYPTVFQRVPDVINQQITLGTHTVSAITFICALFFIGAMGKSAQVPMHVWLPESMEGPTPISALIHAATMVTAGIYMVARMSPLFEYSETMLSVILIVGGTTALFMGVLAIVQTDIKRVIAYSTISQLGYMVVGLGASAYDAAIFHLLTHAFFKALLFLAAGSVIVAMHHEQDMRKMGGLAKYLPVTYLTFMVGSLALCALPPFSGFFSKDIIIEAAMLSHLPGARYAYYCVLIGAFFTSLYTFRAVFMTFHTNERMDAETKSHLHESPWVILIPLVLLAIPSLVIGQLLIQPMLFADTKILGNSIFVAQTHDVLHHLGTEFKGATEMVLHAGRSLPFWLSLLGIIAAFLFTARFPSWSHFLATRFSLIYQLLLNKYGFDRLNDWLFVSGTKNMGSVFYNAGDRKLIDGYFVNGSGHFVKWLAGVSRRMQTGFLYHYAFVMVLGLLFGLVWYARGF